MRLTGGTFDLYAMPSLRFECVQRHKCKTVLNETATFNHDAHFPCCPLFQNQKYYSLFWISDLHIVIFAGHILAPKGLSTRKKILLSFLRVRVLRVETLRFLAF